MIGQITQLTQPPVVDADKQPLMLLGRSNLQTEILRHLISARLQRACYQYDSSETLPSIQDQQLILIDCQTVSPSQAHQLFEKLASQSDFRIALLNAPDTNEISKLALWPQVRGIFTESTSDDLLLQGLKEIDEGGHWLPRDITSRLLDWCRLPPRGSTDISRLTKREIQMLHFLALGYTNSQIAEKTHISEHTVKTHLYNVFKKIDVSNRLQACNWAKTQLL